MWRRHCLLLFGSLNYRVAALQVIDAQGREILRYFMPEAGLAGMVCG